MLPDKLMTKVIYMVEPLHLKGAPVTAEVINSVVKGFIITNDRSLLIENGSYISLSHQWGRNAMYRMEQEGKKMCRWKTTMYRMEQEGTKMCRWKATMYRMEQEGKKMCRWKATTTKKYLSLLVY